MATFALTRKYVDDGNSITIGGTFTTTAGRQMKLMATTPKVGTNGQMAALLIASLEDQMKVIQTAETEAIEAMTEAQHANLQGQLDTWIAGGMQ